MHPILTALREPQNRDETKYHPSEAAGCTLAIWFKIRNARGLGPGPIPRSPNELLIFKLGTIIHEWVQSVYVEQGVVDSSGIEVPISDEKHLITGSADIVTDDTIIDLKTCSWSSFTRHLPHFEHIVQTSIYAYYLGKPKIEIHYIAKDSGQLTKFLQETEPGALKLEEDEWGPAPVQVLEVTPREDLVFAAWKKFEKVEACIDGTPPPPDYSPFEPLSPCPRCPWRQLCQQSTGRRH